MIILIITLAVQCYMPLVWKLASAKKRDPRAILLMNYIVTVIISAAISARRGLFDVLRFLPESRISTIMSEKTPANTAWILVAVGIVTGVLYFVSLYFQQRSTIENGLGISSFFSQVGLVGSLLIAFFFFDEPISLLQWISIGGILVAILLLTGGGAAAVRAPLLLAGLFASYVATGAANKFYAKYAIEEYKTAFLAVVFLFALITAGIHTRRDVRRTAERVMFGRGEVLLGISLGSANLLFSYLNIRCLELLPAALVVPTLSAGGLAVSALLGAAFFGEKVGRRHVLAILLTSVFIVLLNLG